MNTQNGLVIVCNSAVVNNNQFYGIADRAGECGNERTDCMQCGEFLDWLKTSQLSRRTMLKGVS